MLCYLMQQHATRNTVAFWTGLCLSYMKSVCFHMHYNDVITSALASQITSLTIVYSSVYSGADQRKHQSSASLAFVRGIHRRPVNYLHKGTVTRKCFQLITSSWLKSLRLQWGSCGYFNLQLLVRLNTPQESIIYIIEGKVDNNYIYMLFTIQFAVWMF